MKKFKVGQKYVVGQKLQRESGNLIEIIEVIGNTARYKTIRNVKQVTPVSNAFDTRSKFANALKPVENECIVIYRKGREVIALDKLTGEKATARCHPDDEFNFKFGATLAFDRLTNQSPENEKVKFRLGLAIWCEDESQFDGLMKYLNKIGCRWCDGNEKPTEWKPAHADKGLRIYVSRDKEIAFGRSKSLRDNNYTAVDFCNVDFSYYKPLYNGKVVCVDNTRNEYVWTIGKIYQFHDGLITSNTGTVLPDDDAPVHSFKEWQDWTGAKFVEVVE